VICLMACRADRIRAERHHPFAGPSSSRTPGRVLPGVRHVGSRPDRHLLLGRLPMRRLLPQPENHAGGTLPITAAKLAVQTFMQGGVTGASLGEDTIFRCSCNQHADRTVKSGLTRPRLLFQHRRTPVAATNTRPKRSRRWPTISRFHLELRAHLPYVTRRARI